MISFILNLPYTIFGLVVVLITQPIRFEWHTNPFALVFRVKSTGWGRGYAKAWRGVAIGHVIVLNPREEKNDLAHELIHIQQFNRLPFIFPFVYALEILRKGYRNNKYEDEAYTKSASLYKDR